MVTGWAAVAPRAASLSAVMTCRRSGSATMSVSGRISMSSGSWPNSRVIAPEADSRSPVADTSMMTEPDVVHQRPEAGLTAAGQLEAPALGQVA